MARGGEGAARWIVEERADGTNVHGWHWQEKDAMPWARARFEETCVGLRTTKVVEDEGGDGAATIGIETCAGEAYVNKRKGKIIPGYEIELEIAYVGTSNGKTCRGKVRLPYVADENADETPECVVAPAGDSREDDEVKAMVQREIVPKVLDAVRGFVKDMAAGGPGGDAPVSAEEEKKARDAKEAEAAKANAKASASAPRSDKTAPLSQTNHTIKMTENFYCRPRDICECLMDVNRVQHFTRSRASGLNGAPGPFEMFDGNVVGETVEYVPGEKIVQKWRFSSWPDGHHSIVTLTFREPEPGNCFVDLVQTNVPECDKFGNETVMDTTENGWKNLIFARIRQVFGYGA